MYKILFVITAVIVLLCACNTTSTPSKNTAEKTVTVVPEEQTDNIGTTALIKKEVKRNPLLATNNQSDATNKNNTLSIQEVDIAVRDLTNSDDYKKADINKRQEMAKELLTSLEEKNLILHSAYDEENGLYNYVYFDGSSGCIAVKPEEYYKTTQSGKKFPIN